MKNSSYDEVLSKNPIAHIDTIPLLLLFIAAVSVGSVLAWLLKDKYNAKYLIRAYLVYGIIHLFIGLVVLKVALVFIIGSYLLGGIVTIFRSNHYFYS